MLQPPAAWLALGTGSGCSCPCLLSSKESEPGSLWLSRKNAELFCSSAQLFGCSGDGHAAVRGFHWQSKPRVSPFVPWHGNTSTLLPMSPGQQCSGRWALERGVPPAKSWFTLPCKLGAGVSPPAIPALYPAHIRMLCLVQLSWHHYGT